ncbi:MAG: diguanylate cyclase [Deltaproteobacteria bacterium]|nr:diguanylate cyclase [Deltaproteobacteria bacterium]
MMPESERFNKVKLLQVMVAVTAMVWTAILFGLYRWASHAEREHLSRLASLRAESVANHTQALRGWIGGHGGVYVEINPGEEVPYLPGDFPESQVVTPAGRKLTLLSSSAVLGKITKEFKSSSGDQVRLTSIQPMNPDNVPDEWEKKALDVLEAGAPKVEAFVDDGQGSLFRLMYPMELQPRCLRCHDYLVDSPTRIVGGLSVAVDKAPYDRQYDKILHQLSLGYFGVWIVGIIGLASFGVIGSGLLRRIEYASTHDGLTGLLNRREIEHHLTAECERAERYKHQFSVMMLDVDHFKQVNDTYGHQAGDEALRVVAATIRKTIRRTDIAGRYGGEEFLLLAPETSLAEAAELARRLNGAVKDAGTMLPGGLRLSLTVSIGVSALAPDRKKPDFLLKSADESLYRAKVGGRDRVVADGA